MSTIPDTAFMANDAESVSAMSQYTTGADSYTMHDHRDIMNRILADAHLSPVRSQTTIPLKKQSKSGLRRLVSKLTRGTHALQSIFEKLQNIINIYAPKFREIS